MRFVFRVGIPAPINSIQNLSVFADGRDRSSCDRGFRDRGSCDRACVTFLKEEVLAILNPGCHVKKPLPNPGECGLAPHPTPLPQGPRGRCPAAAPWRPGAHALGSEPWGIGVMGCKSTFFGVRGVWDNSNKYMRSHIGV